MSRLLCTRITVSLALCVSLWTVDLPLAADRAAAERGIEQMTQEIQKNPKHANAYVRRGIYHVQLQPDGFGVPLKHLWAAIADFEMALRIEPNNFYARHNYADAAYRAGFDGLAVMEFTKALALNPKSAQTYMGRGWAKLAIGQDAEAQKDFDRTLQLDPSLKPKLLENVQNIRKTQAERRAAAHTLDTIREMGKIWGSMPTANNPCQNSTGPQCKAFQSGDYEAAGRFGMGNQTSADLKKYGQ